MIIAVILLALFEVATLVVICKKQEKLEKKLEESQDERYRLEREYRKFVEETHEGVVKKVNDVHKTYKEDIENIHLDEIEKMKSEVDELLDKVSMKVNDASEKFKILKIFLRTNTCRDNFDFLQKLQESFYRAGVAKVEAFEDNEEDEDGDAFQVKYESDKPYYFHVEYDNDEYEMKFGVFEVGTEADPKKMFSIEFEDT